MRSMIKFLSLLLLTSLVVTNAVNAQDDAKPKGKRQQQGAMSVVDQFLKQLEPAALNDEQKAAVQEILGATQKDVAAKRKEAGITPEILKKRMAARKEGTEAGKKGAELKKHVEAAMGLSEEQVKVLDETEKALTKAKQQAVAKLSADQMAKLPEPMRKALEASPARQGVKKKKGADQ